MKKLFCALQNGWAIFRSKHIALSAPTYPSRRRVQAIARIAGHIKNSCTVSSMLTRNSCIQQRNRARRTVIPRSSEQGWLLWDSWLASWPSARSGFVSEDEDRSRSD